MYKNSIKMFAIDYLVSLGYVYSKKDDIFSDGSPFIYSLDIDDICYGGAYLFRLWYIDSYGIKIYISYSVTKKELIPYIKINNEF